MGCGSSNSKREPIQNSNTPSKMLQDYNGNLNLSAPVAPPTYNPSPQPTIDQKHGQMLHSQQSKQFTLFQEKVHPSAQDSHHQQQMHIPGTSTSTQSNATAPPLEQEELMSSPKIRAGSPKERITTEVVYEFVELEKKIQELENERVEEKFMIEDMEYKNLSEALRATQQDFEQMRQITLKEYQDVTNFNIASYMQQNQVSVLSRNQVDMVYKQEELEHIEARNKMDICQKQILTLQIQLSSKRQSRDQAKIGYDCLMNCRNKVDGLLENIFNGEYGSELEDRLELEALQLLEYKQLISLAHHKWWCARHLIYHSCSQMAYAVKRWMQIKYLPDDQNEARYHVVTDTRNHMIASHQNCRRAHDYLQFPLPYWSESDDKNMVTSVNLIYSDVTTEEGYKKAFGWLKYYHWRYALLIKWMDNVINGKLVADHKRVSKEFREKYHELKMERLQCIRVKVKAVLDVELDIDSMTRKPGESASEDELPLVESNATVTSATQFGEEGEPNIVEAIGEEIDPTNIEEIVNQGGEEFTNERKGDKPMPICNASVSVGCNTSMVAGISTEIITDAVDLQEGLPIGMKSESRETHVMPVHPILEKTQNMSVQTDTLGSQCVSTEVEAENENIVVEEGTRRSSEGSVSNDNHAPAVKLIPLSELAPTPSDNELFGNVQELKKIHKKQLYDLEKAQEKNKTRQEHDFQERLRKRQSKRRKLKLQQEQVDTLKSPRKS